MSDEKEPAMGISVPSRRNSHCKGPEAGSSAFLKHEQNTANMHYLRGPWRKIPGAYIFLSWTLWQSVEAYGSLLKVVFSIIEGKLQRDAKKANHIVIHLSKHL